VLGLDVYGVAVTSAFARCRPEKLRDRLPLNEPLSLRERGWGEGSVGARCQSLSQDFIVALRPNPHPPAGTLSRRERDSADASPLQV
jgi:hypothetical protein